MSSEITTSAPNIKTTKTKKGNSAKMALYVTQKRDIFANKYAKTSLAHYLYNIYKKR